MVLQITPMKKISILENKISDLGEYDVVDRSEPPKSKMPKKTPMTYFGLNSHMPKTCRSVEAFYAQKKLSNLARECWERMQYGKNWKFEVPGNSPKHSRGKVNNKTIRYSSKLTKEKTYNYWLEKIVF